MYEILRALCKKKYLKKRHSGKRAYSIHIVFLYEWTIVTINVVAARCEAISNYYMLFLHYVGKLGHLTIIFTLFVDVTCRMYV